MTQNTVTVFSSPTCGPCKMLKSKLAATEIVVEYVNIEEQPDRADAAGVRGIPTTIISNDTGVLHTIVGAPGTIVQQLGLWL